MNFQEAKYQRLVIVFLDYWVQRRIWPVPMDGIMNNICFN